MDQDRPNYKSLPLSQPADVMFIQSKNAQFPMSDCGMRRGRYYRDILRHTPDSTLVTTQYIFCSLSSQTPILERDTDK